MADGNPQVSKELLDWIMAGLRKGYRPEELRADLKKNGYDSVLIEEAFSHPDVMHVILSYIGEPSWSAKKIAVRVAVVLLVLFAVAGAGVLAYTAWSHAAQSVTIWPGDLVLSDTPLKKGEAVHLKPGEQLAALVHFKGAASGRGNATLIVRATAEGEKAVTLVVTLDGKETGRMSIGTTPATLALHPLHEQGYLTLAAEGGKTLVQSLTIQENR